MSNAEHAIENMLTLIERGASYEDAMRIAENDINYQYIMMEKEECWEIAQYILTVYAPSLNDGGAVKESVGLKSCPFCGGKADTIVVPPYSHSIVDFPDCNGRVFIECDGCICAVCGDTEEEAVKVWNRRAK